jgi:hypothetical protein
VLRHEDDSPGAWSAQWMSEQDYYYLSRKAGLIT